MENINLNLGQVGCEGVEWNLGQVGCEGVEWIVLAYDMSKGLL
jgi:hypothetical protein